MEWGVIFATFLLLLMLFIIAQLILGPLKVVTRFFLNCGLGLAALVIVNLIGRNLGVHMPVNPLCVISIGCLGIPGFILVAFMSYLFMP